MDVLKEKLFELFKGRFNENHSKQVLLSLISDSVDLEKFKSILEIIDVCEEVGIEDFTKIINYHVIVDNNNNLVFEEDGKAIFFNGIEDAKKHVKDGEKLIKFSEYVKIRYSQMK